MGGVRVNVPRTVVDPNYQITTTNVGIRFNAGHILESAGAPMLMRHARIGDEEATHVDLAGHVATLGARVQTLPDSDAGYRIDTALARAAVEIAVRRHAGAIEHVHMVDGDVAIQTGKDLRNVAVVIGTGGILAHGRNPRYVMEGACYSGRDPLSLRPRAPELLVDTQYIFYAMGLLAAAAPEVSVRLQKRSLKSA